MVELLGQTGLLHQRHRLTSTHDGDGVQVGQDLRQRLRAAGELGELGHPQRPVPDHRPAGLERLAVGDDGARSDVHDAPAAGYVVGRLGAGAGVGCEAVGHDQIDGQQEVELTVRRLVDDGAGGLHLVVLHQGVAYGVTVRLEKRVRHATADDEHGGLGQQMTQHAHLVADLRPADDGAQGALRFGGDAI